MDEVLSLEDFRKELGEYWEDCFKDVAEEDRRLVVRTVRELGGVSEVWTRLFMEYSGFWSDFDVEVGFDRSGDFRSIVFSRNVPGEGFVKRVSKEYREPVPGVLEEFPDCYEDYVSASIVLDKKRFNQRALSVLKDVGEDYGRSVLEISKILGLKDDWIGFSFFDWSPFILPLIVSEYKSLVLDDVRTIAETSPEYAFYFFSEAGEVFSESYDSYSVKRDKILIDLVKDHSDANLVYDLVDLDNPGISKEYDKKVGSLF